MLKPIEAKDKEFQFHKGTIKTESRQGCKNPAS